MKTIILGAGGGIGRALADALAARGDTVVGLGRGSEPPVDYDRPETVADAAAALAPGAPYDLIIVATGILHGEGVTPEKSLRAIEADGLDRYFRVNATGPALVMRHFLPLLPKDRRGVFAALSARVGSIGDNRIGGWTGYRPAHCSMRRTARACC